MKRKKFTSLESQQTSTLNLRTNHTSFKYEALTNSILFENDLNPAAIIICAKFIRN